MVGIGRLSCSCHYQLCLDSLNCQKVFVLQKVVSTVYLSWQMFVFSCQYYILLYKSEVLKFQLSICPAYSNFNLHHNCDKARGFTFFKGYFLFKDRDFCMAQTEVCNSH